MIVVVREVVPLYLRDGLFWKNVEIHKTTPRAKVLIYSAGFIPACAFVLNAEGRYVMEHSSPVLGRARDQSGPVTLKDDT